MSTYYNHHYNYHAAAAAADMSPQPKPVDESPSKAAETAAAMTPSPQMMPMMAPEMFGMQSPMPTPMCPCPTCDYYRAAMMYYHDCASPNVDSYAMYPYTAPMAAAMPMMMPQPVTAPSVVPHPSLSMPSMHSSSGSVSRGTSPVNNAMPSATTMENFEKSFGRIAEVACSSSGRSMLQSVLTLQHVDKIEKIFEEVLAAIEVVALDQHGCHVVRSLIEVLDDAQVQRFVFAMNETLILNMCTLTQYTRRVLQALFERHKNSDLQAVVDIMNRNAQYLSATQQGCISLMRVFEQCSLNQKMQLLEPLRPMLADLACDPFGNYVVQCVLENTPKSVAAKIALEAFTGATLKLACDKFGSNVMEKLISSMPAPNVRRVILDELVFNPAALQQLVHDSFGNFVVQSIIESCTHAGEFKKISDRLRSALPNSPFGHKIETKMRNKRFPNTNVAGGRFGHNSTNAQRNAVAAY